MFPDKISCFIAVFLLLLLAGGCSQNDELPERTDTAAGQSLWLVDTTKMTGTNVRDVFPLVTQPVYTRAKDAPRHGLTEKAIVFQLDETVFIFPLWMMGVEMVNGNLNDTYFAVSYCPKTETTYVFNRQIDGKIHTFKASGVLYQDNLVYYDMETGSFWSQMYFKCIHGEHLRKEPQFIHSFETTYENALEHFPDAQVFVDYPGAVQSYQARLKSVPGRGNMILGLQDHISKPGELSVLNYDLLNGKGMLQLNNVTVVYNTEFSYIDAFLSPPGLTLEATGNFPEVLTDKEGNTWNAFGVASDGPRKGERLTGSVSYLGFWWAWEGIFESFESFNWVN